MNHDLLRLAVLVTFVVAGILLIVDAVTLKTALALDSFALAGLAAIAATAPTWRR